MRRLLCLGLAALVAGVALATTAVGATRTISVGDNWFVRSSGVPGVTVNRGTTVRWRWVGRRRHNVRVSRGPVRFSSPTMRSGTYRKRIFTPGRYTIICSIHGAGDQKMILRVRR
jgi:plastocyanin